MQNLMRHMTYTTCQKVDRIYRNSKKEYHLFIVQTGCLNLSEMVSLAEQYEDITPERFQPAPEHESIEQRGVLTQDCCRRNWPSGMSIFDSQVGSERPVATIESSSLVDDIILEGLPLKRIVDTGANRSVPKAFVPDLMLYILESTMVVTKVRMADGTFYQSHNELLTTAKIGKQQFLLSFLILKSVVDNVPRGLDFLKEVGPTLPVTVSE
ncbi:hypothetical protein GQX74_003113 [Glossina fuscipes]|nr:hypothetical protein GQX74_003113 [Glossina fuscipes]